VVSPFHAKALEALAFVTGSAGSERIVAVSTLLDDTAARRLQAFVEADANCVRAGFSAEACGG